MRETSRFIKEHDIQEIYVIPIEVAGYSRGIAEGLVKRGKKVSVVEISPYPFSDPKEVFEGVSFIDVSRLASGTIGLFNWHRRRFQAALEIARNADLVVSQFAMGILPLGLDFLLYKFRRIPIVSLCGYGSEARAPQVNHPQTLASSQPLAHLRLALQAVKRRLKLLVQYRISDFFFASPQTSELIPGAFYNFLDLGHPLSDSTRAKAFTANRNSRSMKSGISEFRIIHAPSSSLTKGTDWVRDVAKLLTSKYENVTYREVSNLGHGDLLTSLSESDLLIDQAYSDYPLPVTSAEALLCGTPAVVAGYYVDWPVRHYSQFVPPSIASSPNRLFENIEKLILQDKESAAALRHAGVDFVNSNFTSELVASRLLACISGEPNSGITRMMRPNPPYRDGLGAESGIIQKYRDSSLSRIVMPELKIQVKSRG
jgi:hypothetical protein